MNILFVCDGNVCRSPMAEALLIERLSQRGVRGVNVSSCGLQAQPWSTADPRLRIVIGDAYKELRSFQSRPINAEIVGQVDLILTMEERHVHEILTRFPWTRGKVATVTAFAGERGEIKDFPESGQSNVLDWLKNCYFVLHRCLDKVVDRIFELK